MTGTKEGVIRPVAYYASRIPLKSIPDDPGYPECPPACGRGSGPAIRGSGPPVLRRGKSLSYNGKLDVPSSLMGVYEFMEAVFSDTREHRFLLRRRVGDLHPDRGVLGWLLLNPSRATATADDPTIRKCMGFAQRLGFGELVVANLCAWRAADPAALKRISEARCLPTVNLGYVTRMVRESCLFICGWGNQGAGHAPAMIQNLASAVGVETLQGKAHYLYGLTRRNQPKHPVRLGYPKSEAAAILHRWSDIVAWAERQSEF